MIGRWLKFNAVGMAGALAQLVTLSALAAAGVHYLLATAIAVEAAILHNYFWHTRWTWRDRPQRSLLRFHLANGLVSLVSNLAWMRLLEGLPLVLANLIAITMTSLVNFLLGDRYVFAQRPHGGVYGLLERFPRHSGDEGPHDRADQKRHIA